MSVSATEAPGPRPLPMPGLRDAGVLLLLLVTLFAAYFPTLLGSYAFVDDYFWLDMARHHPGELFTRLAEQGRPLNGLILKFFFQLASGIPSLIWIRGVTIFGLAIMSWTFYLAICFNGWKRTPAFFLAAMASCLPAMQVYAAWATSVPIPLSGILAILAALLTSWGQDCLKRRWPSLAIAALMLLASATIYQPTAMLFWPVAALDLFRDELGSRQALRRFVVHLLVAGFGLFLAWLVLHYYQSVITLRYSPSRDHLTNDPLKKLNWFIHHPLVDSMNLFLLWPRRITAIVVELVIVAGLFMRFSRISRTGPAKVILVFALLLLSYLPNLLVAESWSSYRTQIALSWLALLLLFIAIPALWPRKAGWMKAGHILAIAVFTVAVSQAAGNTWRFFVDPQRAEIRDFRSELAAVNSPRVTRIILLQPGATNSLCPFSRYDEFGRNSLTASWVPQSAVNLIREEADPNAPRIEVDTVPDFVGQWTEPLPEGTVLIDMRYETQL